MAQLRRASRGLPPTRLQTTRMRFLAHHRGTEHAPDRTVHAIAYDEIHDEIVVQSNIGHAVVTYRAAPTVTKRQSDHPGPKRCCAIPTLFVDPVHNEIFVFKHGDPRHDASLRPAGAGRRRAEALLKSPAAPGGVGAADRRATIFLSVSVQRHPRLRPDGTGNGKAAARHRRRSESAACVAPPDRRPLPEPKPLRHQRAGGRVAGPGDERAGADSWVGVLERGR